jgi:hypothetical protein
MAKLSIHHHERVEGHPHRWHVYLHGRPDPITVELPPDERESLDMSDEEIHDFLPTALERHHATTNRDDVLPGEEYHDASAEAPVRIFQTHFTG